MSRGKTGRGRKTADVGEFELIDMLCRKLDKVEGVALGVGDDAAILETKPGYRIAVSKDLLVEDVHFRRSNTKPSQLGHKALAVNLSDLAAMGAQPMAVLVGLALPGDVSLYWLRAFYQGMRRLADKTGCSIVGGDTTGSTKAISISITIIGQVERSKELRRSGATSGDELWLCGELGLSRAGLESLENGWTCPGRMKKAHLEPQALLEEGRALLGSGQVRAAIDVSDGLLGDLGHICKRSGVGAEIDIDRLPINPVLQKWSERRSLDAMEYVLRGGEDYALLCATIDKPKKWSDKFQPLVKIGRFISQRGIFLMDERGNKEKVSANGFDHFSGKH